MVVATDRKKVSAYLSEGLKDKADRLAKLKKRSLSNLIEVLLEEAVEEAEANGELSRRSALQQRLDEPKRPPLTNDEMRQLIGDDDPHNPYTPPGSRIRGGKK